MVTALTGVAARALTRRRGAGRPGDGSAAAYSAPRTRAPAAVRAYIGDDAVHGLGPAQRSRHRRRPGARQSSPSTQPQPLAGTATPARTSAPCSGRTPSSPTSCSPSATGSRPPSSSSPRRTSPRPPSSPPSAPRSPTSTPRATPAPATTAAASRSTPPSGSRSSGPRPLFGAEHANVQPHSGSSAVLAAYAALLRPGDTVLAMGLAARRAPHPRGARQLLRPLVRLRRLRRRRRTGLIDYARCARWPAPTAPRRSSAARSPTPATSTTPRSARSPTRSGAYLIADAAHPIGLVAGGAAPSPVPYADVVCATTHKVLRGPRGGMILCGAELARADRPRGVPLHPGRRADAHRRGQGRRVRGGGDPGLRGVRPPGRRQRPGPRAPGRRGLSVSPPAAPTPTCSPPTRPRSASTAGPRAAGSRRPGWSWTPARCRTRTRRGLRLGTAAVTTQGMGERRDGADRRRCSRAVLRGDARPGRPRGPRCRAPGRREFPPYPELRWGGRTSRAQPPLQPSSLPGVLYRMRASLGCGAEMASESCGEARA